MVKKILIMDLKRFIRRLSLVQKFSISVFLLIMILMIAITFLILAHQRSILRSEMEKSHLVVVKNLSKEALEPLLIKDPLRLDEIVKRTHNVPGCLYAVINDINGRVVAHTDRKKLGSITPLDISNYTDLVTSSGKNTAGQINDNIKKITIPVKTGDEILGIITVGFSKRDVESAIEENLKPLKKNIFLISGIVMLLGIWGSFGLARVLTTPMKKLKSKMELVQQGNLNVEVPNEYLVNCWEILNCEKKDCPAYGEKRCWTISNTLCEDVMQKSPFEKMCNCKECTVYKLSCGDEIGELVEGFNQMINALKDGIRRLEETNKEKMRLERLSALGEMSMTVAHEIKNPLNAIKGAVCYLKENFRGEILNEFLSIIESETKRLNEIVTSFLRFSRPVPLNLRLSNINSIIEETVELIRQEATENNVEVITVLSIDIPLFRFDPEQLKQAILNLIVNALDATKEGDTIKISTDKFDTKVRITISDTGIGIDEELISDIFKPFFTTKTRGSGLGLACVDRIVKDHKGDVIVKSKKGIGTEITILLPIVN
jgi:sensor histidine kinase regulating citrate/malate metabolism